MIGFPAWIDERCLRRDGVAVLYDRLPAELRCACRANLALLSLLEPVEGMPDPLAHLARVAALLRSFDQREAAT